MADDLAESHASRIGTWASCPRPRRDALLRLFCLPYAGGGGSIYHNWSRSLPEWIEVWLVHLPGRERRMSEPPIADMAQLADAAAAGLAPFLSGRFALFGHSMGALIAFELARSLQRQGRPLPARLVVSAFAAPDLVATVTPIHDLPDEAFLRELEALYGTPRDALANVELLSMLRADFRAVETYRFVPGQALDCPIVAYIGADDLVVSSQSMEAWRRHTGKSFLLRTLAGDHFYLRSDRTQLWEHLARDLGA